MADEHAGHRQRMKERFLRNGLEGFADHEVLELLLFYAIPRQNTNPLAHRLLEYFGSLHGVMDASVEELTQMEGMGMGAATLISLIANTSRRLDQSRNGAVTSMKNRGDSRRYCVQLLRGRKEENFYVIGLNAQMQVLGNALISKGTVDEVQAYPRQVAAAVMRFNARYAVLCHNHPGGNVVPSQQDMEVTRSLGELCSKLSVTLLDHVIITEDDSFSMLEWGLIRLKDDQPACGILSRVADSNSELLIRSRLEKEGWQKKR